MGGLLLICNFFFNAPSYLFWLGLGYIVPSFSLAAQSFMSNQQLTMTAPFLGGLYLFGAWSSAYAMALRKKGSSHALIALLVTMITLGFLVYYSYVDQQLWIRMLVLNIAIATIGSLVLRSTFANYQHSDWLNKIVDFSYFFIVLYTFIRSIIIYFFLRNIDANMLANSAWWLMMLAASILLSLWFAIVLLGTLVRDVILKLNDERSRDPLTHLLNRRGFYDAAKVNLFELPQKKYFLLMCDVDHFKKINDTYGHLVGDQILQRVGYLVSQNVRDDDLVGRFGGEEFIVLLQVADAAFAYEIAERMRIAIETEHFSSQKILLTASFGLAQVKQRNLNFGIEVADKRLYAAKRAGRNCIVQD
ncbi:GGDEF domain-containing protein [Acinetobacter sp.]|jgi:diguanylate cyclase (GGDEF)-like protein|uniref:GGDEF domain-containing protein n=1 Tax=Acinetobacter sp. TaxID=472 RepID=UPI00281AD370|nr:GGDEF domain-containing protein [Acinetobacter sp.]MDR0235890.1 GGDEF domain-containing protein [Acinetobacter sp.]